MPAAQITTRAIESIPSQKNVRRGRAITAAARDSSHQQSDSAQPHVGALRRDDHGSGGKEIGEQEQRDLERVAAEDVADGELHVAQPNRRDAARDLRQGRCRREERRAEDRAFKPHSLGKDVAGVLKGDARTERDQRAGSEDHRHGHGARAGVRARLVSRRFARMPATGRALGRLTHPARMHAHAVHDPDPSGESSAPARTVASTTTTIRASRTGTSDPTRNDSGRSGPETASRTTSTSVWTATPPIRFPTARSRWPESEADAVIAISGRLPVIATRPPSASPRPNRTSSASVVFDG
jgi:hypothetical protein